MIPDPAYIKQLFIKHAQGTCSVEEIAILVSYLQEGGSEDALPWPEELDDQVPGRFVMEVTTAERILNNIPDLEKENPVARPRLVKWRWMAAAAVAAVVVVAGGILYKQTPRKTALATLATGYGEIRNIVLPDGSSVTLNANAVLQYDSIAWNTNQREVWLNGEAFFNVAPDAAGKFIVHAGNALKVQVLGTRFNVMARTNDIRVVLNSGKVKVDLSNGNTHQTVVLDPGEMADYTVATGMIQRISADTSQLTSWRNNQLIFHGSNLKDISEQIEEQFGVKVILASPELANLQFTGTTPANDLGVMLTILEKTLDIKIDRSDNRVTIRQAR
jgi:ferric-dicitrate binding protein FerR (iron transport regulator)